MNTSGTTKIFLHGITLKRANSIIAQGPDPQYREPADLLPSGGFCVMEVQSSHPIGSPEEYAQRKAMNFPNEGGPVILEMEIPEVIAELSKTPTGDYQFDYG